MRNSPLEHQLTFSSYKIANFLKGISGTTLNGVIDSISPLYNTCESISDKQFFIKSELMDRLNPKDVVMADKSFLIAEELESIGYKIQCPTFLKGKIYFIISKMVSNSKLSTSTPSYSAKGLYQWLSKINFLKLTEVCIMKTTCFL
ncbi:THAP-type domain-containing protein [Nephila pilipes]|uniref:THAP-type domain-containing protein n=1 Tax=Nephila pilipes TaxID=299642 RepID=A0A8X6IJC7_NEPPI|nr:THAP-type domain-containing protein [Nephila pilipes]